MAEAGVSALKELARAAGLDPDYHSWRGEPVASSDEALLAAIRALGVDVAGPDDAPRAIAELERARWEETVPPVVHGWDGCLIVPFAVRADVDGAWEIEVVTEAGKTIRAQGRLFDLPADSHAWPGGVVHCVRRARVWVDNELGYHEVRWRLERASGSALGIAAPMRAWGGPGAGARRWGVFAPVYGLASAESGETGDLGTLRRVFEAVSARGGKYVATLPVLAAFLDEPCMFSPYSPASRLYWNELYLHLAPLAASVGLPAPVVPALPMGELIDYKAQHRWHRAAWEPIAQALYAARAGEIDAWAAANEAYDYAAFRAVGEVQRASWRDWPAAWREPPAPIASRAEAIAAGLSAERVTAHVVGQWAMQQQLEALATPGGASLYLDLPVGVSIDAYEVWRHRGLFLTGLAAGAPPDALFLGGQNWGLPPLSPVALRRDRYRYVVRCIRHHMRVAGMLRVDHVMGLFRLYCVPAGRPATDGVYLRYHPDELLAILTLESNRAHCALVGEDLGTVPEQVRPAMARHGLFRIHVGQWYLPTTVGETPGIPPAESVAGLNTHDTATFAGWWHGADIADRLDLSLISPAQAQVERDDRALSRAAMLDFASGAGDTADLSDVGRALVAATSDLAEGPAEVVLITLDDLALAPIQHNVPGTTTERANWQRRVEGWATALDPAGPATAVAAVAAVAGRS
ncbi:MAG: 4-alpha-glucanotransferase [Deltaproteobacteria bacterium]|nr:4-alpha-glucanotransferase [Deltaproteobacteria bacterium]